MTMPTTNYYIAAWFFVIRDLEGLKIREYTEIDVNMYRLLDLDRLHTVTTGTPPEISHIPVYKQVDIESITTIAKRYYDSY